MKSSLDYVVELLYWQSLSSEKRMLQSFELDVIVNLVTRKRLLLRILMSQLATRARHTSFGSTCRVL